MPQYIRTAITTSEFLAMSSGKRKALLAHGYGFFGESTKAFYDQCHSFDEDVNSANFDQAVFHIVLIYNTLNLMAYYLLT